MDADAQQSNLRSFLTIKLFYTSSPSSFQVSIVVRYPYN